MCLVAKTIFSSMIHPLFYYCYPIFGGQSCSWTEKLNSLIVRANQIIKCQHKWSSWSCQRKRRVAVDVFKAVNGITVNNGNYKLVDHKVVTRANNAKLVPPAIKSEAGRKLSYYQGAIVFNSLPINVVKEKSLLIFKNIIKDFVF